MPRPAHLVWDVPGIMYAHQPGHTEMVTWHVKTYEDGHGYARIGDIWLPIAPTMTAVEYLEGAFWHMFGDPAEARAAGD